MTGTAQMMPAVSERLEVSEERIGGRQGLNFQRLMKASVPLVAVWNRQPVEQPYVKRPGGERGYEDAQSGLDEARSKLVEVLPNRHGSAAGATLGIRGRLVR